jgi:hypothetical protein
MEEESVVPVEPNKKPKKSGKDKDATEEQVVVF